MSDVKEAPRPARRTEQKRLADGPSGKIGWDVAVLVALGAAFALAGVALLVIGSFMH